MTGLSAGGIWRSPLPLEAGLVDEERSRTFGFFGTGGGTWKDLTQGEYSTNHKTTIFCERSLPWHLGFLFI